MWAKVSTCERRRLAALLIEDTGVGWLACCELGDRWQFEGVSTVGGPVGMCGGVKMIRRPTGAW